MGRDAHAASVYEGLIRRIARLGQLWCEQSLLFTWCSAFVVASSSLPSWSWPASSVPTKRFAACEFLRRVGGSVRVQS